MYPELLRIGDFHISSFGAMVALSFVLALWISSVEFRRKGMSPKLLEHGFLACVAGGMLGARLLFLVENFSVRELLSRPMEYLLLRGGFTFYGGFLLSVLGLYIVSRKHRESFWKILDACAPGCAIAYATGRVGCFLVGDDYGVPSSLPWAMAFPKGSPPTLQTVHPTQVYEAVVMTLVFLFLWKIRNRKRPAGWLAGIYFALAGIERFLVEFIRNTTESPVSGLSVAQVTALVLIAVGTFKYLSTRRGRHIEAGAPTAE